MSTSISKAIHKTWAFRSSNGHTMYQTLLFAGGETSCDCPGWTRRVAPDGSRSCKHTRMVELGIADSIAEKFMDYWPWEAKLQKNPKLSQRKQTAIEDGPVLVRDINLED